MGSRTRKLKTIERRWRERFGEPPCLRTDPDLMLRILEADILNSSSGAQRRGRGTAAAGGGGGGSTGGSG